MPLLPRKNAIDLAMEARRRPELVSILAAAPLPRDVKSLLRIAADGGRREAGAEHVYRKHSPEAVREACTALLSVILFNRGADPYRVLGLPAGASEDEVREHKRLLLKWLHPDRNPTKAGGGRERELLSRVLDAAAIIEGKRPMVAQIEPPPIPSRPSTARRVAPRATPATKKGEAPVLATSWQRSLMLWKHSFKLKLARTLTLSFRSLWRAGFALAALLAALIVWRYVMEEPIGLSLQRYSEAALGLVSW